MAGPLQHRKEPVDEAHLRSGNAQIPLHGPGLAQLSSITSIPVVDGLAQASWDMPRPGYRRRLAPGNLRPLARRLLSRRSSCTAPVQRQDTG